MAFAVNVYVAATINPLMRELSPQQKHPLVAIKNFMRQAVSVGGQVLCCQCAKPISVQPLPVRCPLCDAEWKYVIPCFLYIALAPLDNSQRVHPDHERLCYEIAPGLRYIHSVGLARIAPNLRGGYDIDAEWEWDFSEYPHIIGPRQ